MFDLFLRFPVKEGAEDNPGGHSNNISGSKEANITELIIGGRHELVNTENEEGLEELEDAKWCRFRSELETKQSIEVGVNAGVLYSPCERH